MRNFYIGWYSSKAIGWKTFWSLTKGNYTCENFSGYSPFTKVKKILLLNFLAELAASILFG